jgi:drug/metabolite transporter (DMT)-like permease
VLSGLIVWHELPNPLAFSGIALIIASGVAIVILDQRRGRDDVVVANSV